jgi:ABC-type amino acid transport substrate-binding protein
MRLVAGRFAAALLLMLSLFGDPPQCSAEDVSSPELPPLKWAADSEGGAPYIFLDPQNADHYIGFEVELAEALGKELGRRIEYVQYDFKSLVPGLKRNDFDFAMNGLEVTPDRAKAIRFTKPYYIDSLQLVVRADDSRFTTALLPANCGKDVRSGMARRATRAGTCWRSRCDRRCKGGFLARA